METQPPREGLRSGMPEHADDGAGEIVAVMLVIFVAVAVLWHWLGRKR